MFMSYLLVSWYTPFLSSYPCTHVMILFIVILIFLSLLFSLYTCHISFLKYSFLLILLKGWLLPATPRSSPCAMTLKQSCKPATREGTVGRHRHARRKGSGLPNHRWCVFFPPISCLRTKKKLESFFSPTLCCDFTKTLEDPFVSFRGKVPVGQECLCYYSHENLRKLVYFLLI